jgi:hypothetical protein
MQPILEQVVPSWQLNRAMLFVRQYNWSRPPKDHVPTEWVEELIYYYYLGAQAISVGLNPIWASTMYQEFYMKLPRELAERIFPSAVV